jgi:hypothetical protein
MPLNELINGGQSISMDHGSRASIYNLETKTPAMHEF